MELNNNEGGQNFDHNPSNENENDDSAMRASFNKGLKITMSSEAGEKTPTIKSDGRKLNVNKDVIMLNNNKTSKNYKLNFYANNVRGLQSKIATVKNILVEGEIDIAVICETHNKGVKNIKIDDYVCYYNNRTLREKGGTAIYVHEKWANNVMKLESGLDHNEYFIIKIESTVPSTVVIAYYGVIENQFHSDEIKAMQSDLFQMVAKYCEEGNEIYWCGDFNNSIANNLGLRGNTGVVSGGGQNLIDFVTEQNLSLLNCRDMAHTHFDRTAGTSKILDFVITNVPDKVSSFKIDKTLQMTPYRIKKSKQGHFLVHTDHVGISWTSEVTTRPQTTNKTIMWNYNKPNGGYRYIEATDNYSDMIDCRMMETDDVENIAEYILELVDEAKKVAFGKVTKTKSQLRRQSDKMIWRKRTKEVEKAIKSVEGAKFRTNERIWEMRSRLSDKFSDKQFVGVRNPQTGEMTKSREETFACTLKYNHDLLKKDEEEVDEGEDEKDEGGENMEEIRQAKDEAIKLALSLKEFEGDEELDYKDFEEVMKKIKISNKNVYRDLVKAGDSFKRSVFKFYNLCYMKEVMPASFFETNLLKLFKGKGVRTELKSNRFIHLKGWLAKTYEKMLMTKLEGKMFSCTPELQVGGQKQGSTNEHLLSMIISMRRLEESQNAGGIIFLDIKACFDRVRLSDILYETIQSGVVGRPLINIKKYTDNLTIKLIGDPDDTRKAEISNSTGQGSGFAPVGTSLVMAKTLAVRIGMRSEEEQRVLNREVNNIKLYHNFFVDDLAKSCGSNLELKLNGEVITETLVELNLDAHPDKSGVLVFGKKKEKLRDEIARDPPKVQSFNLGFKEKETYLGMVFAEGGADESISLTLANRRGRCLGKAATIKRILSDERMMGIGWLASAVLLHSSIVVSTLTYGAAAFTGLKKKHWEDIESIQRQCLIHILGISQKSPYITLLLVLGILPAKDVVKKLQITFINNLIHIKGRGQCLDTLLREDSIGDNKGLMSEVREYCTEYGIEDVTRYYVHPKEIRERIEQRVLTRLWLGNVEARKPPLAPKRYDLRTRYYSKLPMNKAKLALCWELGDLNFRASRRCEAMRKYGSIQCLVPFCPEDDSFEHVRTCKGYTAQLQDDDPDPFKRIDYLTDLEEERRKRFRRSLINHKVV